MSDPDPGRCKAIIFGCAGPSLEDDERRFFAASQPFGFILFARNCETPDQVRRLVAELRGAVDRADAPVLIDQEGGRVARLKPPHWRAAPPAAAFGARHAADRDRAVEAAGLNGRLIAGELFQLGIDVDCLPVLDMPVAGASEAIGDRAFAGEPTAVSELGRAAADGLLAGGVLPVIKHLPGQGRARTDSHVALPVVDAPWSELDGHDFVPFRALADLPWGMTGHVLFNAIDPARPATVSPSTIDRAIRGAIGFDGLLLSDDLSMQALTGAIAERAVAALAAGCDVALHCNGVLAEMRAVAAAIDRLTEPAVRRVRRGSACRAAPAAIDPAALVRRLGALLAANT